MEQNLTNFGDDQAYKYHFRQIFLQQIYNLDHEVLEREFLCLYEYQDYHGSIFDFVNYKNYRYFIKILDQYHIPMSLDFCITIDL